MKIRCTYNQMKVILAYPKAQELETSGTENLLFTGAKAYHIGGGWWRIHGYGNNDAQKAIKGIFDPIRRAMVQIGAI